MVVKTQVCNFSEWKIYPGKGVSLITKESKLLTYINKKARSHALRKVKPQKIRWAVAWRRLNKKMQTGNERKKRRRKAKKVERAIVGMELETITRKRNETKETRQNLRQKAIKEIRDRKQRANKGKKGRR